MNIDWFCYELWYNSFPINPINLKLTGYVHTRVVNIYTNFEVICIKFYFRTNLRLLAKL